MAVRLFIAGVGWGRGGHLPAMLEVGGTSIVPEQKCSEKQVWGGR